MQILPPSSVVELIKSGRMSNSVVVLQDEVEPTQSMPESLAEAERAYGDVNGNCNEITDPATTEDENVKHLTMENAARVALLLSRSFANLCQLSNVGHDDTCHKLSSSIRLDDFFVNREHRDKALDTNESDGPEQKQKPQDIQPGFFSRFDGKNDDYHDCYTQAVVPKKTKKKRYRKKKLTIKEQLIRASIAESGWTAPENQGAVGSEQIQGGHLDTNGASNGVQRSVPTRYKTFPRNVLLSVGMLRAAKLSDSDCTSTILPIQVLGKMLYYVFSLGKSLPPDLLEIPQQGNVSSNYLNGDNIQRYQRLRKTERTVFSRLIESNIFSTSICRLLSDMIDLGPDGMADLPFTSFDDVIQDLEEMISKPHTLLHGSCLPPSGPQASLFGKKLFSRTKEISTLMDITHRMKQSCVKQSGFDQVENGNDQYLQSGIEVVFVSGVAGSGKSHLVQGLGETLSSSDDGWIVIKSKFKRGMEHASRMIVLSMFDELIALLVKMKESGDAQDVAYSKCTSNTILDAIGHDNLASISDVLPSLLLLFDSISGDENRQTMNPDELDWVLINSLSIIFESMLKSDRFMMICCDDLQWADKTALSLIREILINVGDISGVNRHLLFVGLYRDIDDQHPFSIEHSYLQTSSAINTTEIMLHNLSKEAVVDIISTEWRLTQRYVKEIADVVYKRTLGHIYFVIELLNSLLRDSIVTYNTQKQRYVWDEHRIDLIQTGTTVAGFISQNLSYLPTSSQRILQILSCFGIQTDISLLHILENYQAGILSSLEQFVESGILDIAGPIVMFTHDLIQEATYSSIPMVERQKMHLEIGEFLSSQFQMESVIHDTDKLHLNDQAFFAGRSMTSSLISLACDQIDQIDFVGSNFVIEEDQKQKFAHWNLVAGRIVEACNDWFAAQYYFSKGISFLGQDCWRESCFNLCHELHKGAVTAAYALGEADNVAKYAEMVSVNVQFEDSLQVQAVALRTLSQSGAHHEECISKGLDTLHRLGLNIPSAPSPESVKIAMAKTKDFASNFTINQMIKFCEMEVDETTNSAVNIMDAIFVSCVESGSPYLPLVSCAIVDYSLQRGKLPHESTAAFATFGMLHIFLEENYAQGRYWADNVRAMIAKHQSRKTVFRAELILWLAIDIWFEPPRAISQKILQYQKHALRYGLIDDAMISLQMGWRYLLYGGENLALIFKSADDRLRLAAKHNQFFLRYMVVTNLLLTELTGKTVDWFSVFEGSISSLDDLQAEAESRKNVRLLYDIQCHKLLIAYWKEDFISAEEYSHSASLMSPTSKMPNILLIYRTFFGGLVAFRLYRDFGGTQRFNEGIDMMNRLGKWAYNSTAVFENKWRLLQAEYFVSIRDKTQAKAMFKASIQASQDHGNIHELALGLELQGNYYNALGSGTDATASYKRAYACYAQWGATAIANKLLRRHNLSIDRSDAAQVHGVCKRSI